MNNQLDPSVHEWAKYERLILFDGVCNWCNVWVNFVIAHDPDGQFKFGTLQSEPAQRILRELNLPATDYQTFLLLEGGRVSTKSVAALRVLRQLSWWWPLYYVGVLVPGPLQDVVYDFVARHRYRWMGKAETCRVPSPEERGRFVGFMKSGLYGALTHLDHHVKPTIKASACAVDRMRED